MAEESRSGRPDGGGGPAGDEDLAGILPLELIRTQVVPPAPNRREPAIDWLYDFGGFSWIAYGAGSLLVISHCPFPISREETQVGPFFKQVLELPPTSAAAAAASDEGRDGSPVINAVAWCHSRPSYGEIAAGLGNCVWVHSPNSRNAQGSLCWRQILGLVQSYTVEAIEWTKSGDGLIAVGIEVVSWKRKEGSWEIAWKSRAGVPQTLVSATLSVDGPVATVAHVAVCSSGIKAEDLFPLSRETSEHVFVYNGDSKSGVLKVELCHPQPVSIIQWRPSSVTQPNKDATHSRRDVLLTCCLDGAVRLWCEIDSGRPRKSSKDISDQKSTKPSFHVIAIIEINQCLKGMLGKDISIAWAAEIQGMLSKDEGIKQYFSTKHSEFDQIGSCEWLIGAGPGLSLTFWAIHCLDDTSPLRFPRVTLWKKQNLMDLKVENICSTEFPNSGDRPILVKAVVSRSQLYSPPVVCSLLQLLPDNSVSWSHLYSPTSVTSEDESSKQSIKEKSLSCFAGGVQSQDSHTGSVLQLAVHPCCSEVELAVSLDSNGFLLFWSISTTSNYNLGMQMLADPTWQLVGKIATQDFSSGVEYSRLCWAPSVLSENSFLLLGHAEGVDCLLINISNKECKRILCHKFFTIPYAGYSHGNGPDYIFATPLASPCRQSFVFNSFMLLGIWMMECQALSWEIVMHSDDLSGCSFGYGYDAKNIPNSQGWKYECSFAGRRYYVTAYLCSSTFPESHNFGQITSVAAVCPENLNPFVQQTLACPKGLDCNLFLYHMVTSHFDGTLRLWRAPSSESYNLHSDRQQLPWDLVGMFTAHQGPVSMISLSSCGRKIATACISTSNGISDIHLWEPVFLVGGGSFLLEDKISVDGAIVALSWSVLGNGHFLLGVCLPNELQIYSQKRSTDPVLVKSGKSSEMQNWVCIAVCHTCTASCDFVWGPKVTPVLLHESHFSVFSQWSLRTNEKHQEMLLGCNECNKNYSAISVGEHFEDFLCVTYTDSKISNIKDSAMNDSSEACKFSLLGTSNKQNDYGVERSCKMMSQQQYVTGIKIGLYNMLRIADKLCKSLPVYHPKALLLHLYSGNWKRAYAVVRHLSGFLNSSDSKSGKSCHIIPEICLADYFKENLSTSLQDKKLEWGHEVARETSTMHFQQKNFNLAEGNSFANVPKNTTGTSTQKYEITGFLDTLEKSHKIASVTDVERTQILAIVDILSEINDPRYASVYESLDEPGRRFWVSVRFQRLFLLRKFGRLPDMKELVVDASMIAWALQSDCQDNLFSSVLSTEPSWLEMRNLGVGFWFTNPTQLRLRMEKLARLQYLKRRDPKDCALLYIALNRLQVLAGLFKISKDEKDKPLIGFLARNFQEEKNKSAALKNAYVLMGRRQLELAIAFFLLGGDPSSAVTVCAKNFGDEQLALVICRLIEGYGGPLERHLILNFLLPTAIDKGDHWLSSLFEWTLGNYSDSFKRLLDSQMDSTTHRLAVPRATISDSDIGYYCVIVASKNGLRNSVGDFMAAVLSKWATLMSVISLERLGLPLEALECLSSSFSNSESKNQCNILDIEKDSIFHGILYPFSSIGRNWLAEDVACHLELKAKLSMVMQFISKLEMEHPIWPEADLVPSRELIDHMKCDSHFDGQQMEKFEHNMNKAILLSQQKYSLEKADIINMILVSAYNNGMLFLGHQILHSYISQECLDDKHHLIDSFFLCPVLPKLLVKAVKEICFVLDRYTLSCSYTDSASNLSLNRRYDKDTCGYFHSGDFCLMNNIYSVRSLRPLLKIYGLGMFTADFTVKTFVVLDLLEFLLYFASAWSQRNFKGLIAMIHPILNAIKNEQSFLGDTGGNLMEFLSQTSELIAQNASINVLENLPAANSKQGEPEQCGLVNFPISEDEKWQLIGSSLWRHLFTFCKRQLSFVMTERLEDETNTQELIKMFPVIFAQLLLDSLAFVSSSLTKWVASFLMQKAEKGLHVSTFLWLKEASQSETSVLHHSPDQRIATLQLTSDENQESLFKMLWEISVDSKEICKSLIDEKINFFPHSSQKLCMCWKDIENGLDKDENSDTISDQEGRINVSAANFEAESHSTSPSLERESFLGNRKKDFVLSREAVYFHNPKEEYRKSGELLEAICFNSIDEGQVALASNRRGLLFFNWKVEGHFREQAEYIWSESDWPPNGWAGSESTPIPTFVSRGIGLGSRKGAHLGLGGATIGVNSLARPGRDLTGGGAFGIPGYAGIGASGLGWGEQEDFEEYRDPPATVENISTRALSSHPSKPFFLVGSSNTHVYLWEFGKDGATATYGILPAANVPPPYALASISALQFDPCGHRFGTAALDGTICTWQLEVGGRSNVYPTESSLCFNSHAADVAYVAASGSILAAAGCSTNNVNVVIWDTLAPPATSQASLICHEGGARSLSVFDNDIGSGSISPKIVTGGKNGDVGLHDFRFIATGRTKRHRHPSEQNFKEGTFNKFSENVNGMLWHIPKAHLGSVTKIATIPHTSLFLTGSKDGDVKLWDAKRSELVFHWQKLHERHTFLQPSSRGFGGVVRAAVTDIQVLSHGFLTCGGDGSVKLLRLKDFSHKLKNI